MQDRQEEFKLRISDNINLTDTGTGNMHNINTNYNCMLRLVTLIDRAARAPWPELRVELIRAYKVYDVTVAQVAQETLFNSNHNL